MTHSASQSIDAIIWTDTEHAGRDGQIVDRLGAAVRVVAVGGPRTAEVDALARRLNCPHGDDLRKMLTEQSVPCILLGSPETVTHKDLCTAVADGSLVLTLEPLAVTPNELEDLFKDATTESYPAELRLAAIPAFLRCEGWNQAADPLEAIGQIESISFASYGRVDDCSLFARLVDAWRVMLEIAPLAVTIDATLSGPLPSAPEDPRGLTGHIACHARLPDGAAVLVQVSDRAGEHQRRLTVIGRDGRLDVDEHSYRLCSIERGVLDHGQTPGNTSFAAVVAADWVKALSQPGQARPEQLRRVARIETEALACCLATGLSARTGEPESPHKMLRMR